MVTLWLVQPSAPITGSAVADWRLTAKVAGGPKSDESTAQDVRALPDASIARPVIAASRLIAKVARRGPKSDEFAPQEVRAW